MFLLYISSCTILRFLIPKVAQSLNWPSIASVPQREKTAPSHRHVLPTSQHTSPSHGLQVSLPLHPRPLHWPSLRSPSCSSRPLHHRTIRALLRSLRILDLYLLHCPQLVLTHTASATCCGRCRCCETRLSELACGVEGCGRGVELEAGGAQCGSEYLGYET